LNAIIWLQTDLPVVSPMGLPYDNGTFMQRPLHNTQWICQSVNSKINSVGTDSVTETLTQWVPRVDLLNWEKNNMRVSTRKEEGRSDCEVLCEQQWVTQWESDWNQECVPRYRKKEPQHAKKSESRDLRLEGPAVSELVTQRSGQPAESAKVKWTAAVSERVVVEV